MSATLPDTVPSDTSINAWPGRPALLGLSLLIAATLLIVWQDSLATPLHFDDETLVRDPHIRSLSWNTFSGNRPLGRLSFAANVALSGYDPFALHLTNLLIHVANALLVFAGLVATGRLLVAAGASAALPRRWTGFAAAVALIWGLHPLTTQAVTYAVQRYESLAATGCLVAWLGLLVHAGGRRPAGVAPAAAGVWSGVLSKEIAAMALPVLLLFDRTFLSLRWSDLLAARRGLYLAAATPFLWFLPSVFRSVAPVPGRTANMGFGLQDISWWEYLRTHPEVLLHYLKLAAWPQPLCFDYGWPVQDRIAVSLVLGAAILVLIGGSVWLWGRSLRRRPGDVIRASRATGRGDRGDDAVPAASAPVRGGRPPTRTTARRLPDRVARPSACRARRSR